MKELKEQLTRCELWLEECPEDIEVIEKAKELRTKINNIENSFKKEELEKKINKKEKEIRELKKSLTYRFPILKGFEVECYALAEISKSINESVIKELNTKIEEYNNLVLEYRKLGR